jgi:hypothetical protein
MMKLNPFDLFHTEEVGQSATWKKDTRTPASFWGRYRTILFGFQFNVEDCGKILTTIMVFQQIAQRTANNETKFKNLTRSLPSIERPT